MRIAVVLLMLLTALAGGVGCKGGFKEDKPATQKVEGKVTYRDGKPYRQGGAIEFRHDTKEGVSSMGEIQPDGAFVLHTMTAQHKVPGAPAGSHTVTIIPASKDQNIQPIVLMRKYEIAAGDNKLTVDIDD